MTLETFVLFQPCLNDLKKDFCYISNIEAVKRGILTVIDMPTFLKRGEIYNYHNNTCKGICAPVWYKTYLNGLKLKKNQKYILLFHESHIALNNPKFFVWLKKKYKVKCVLLIQNPISNKMHPSIDGGIDLYMINQYFDLIVTDELKDAKLYQMVFMPDSFSVITQRKAKIKFDICFSGADKKRAELLNQIAVVAEKEGIKYDFRIMAGGRERKKYPQLTYMEWQSYLELIKQDMQSNCILEILQPGQSSSTLRLQEAVCLNKKLLTNNLNVMNEKFYNPQYIQIFDTPEHINWNFVRERIVVDYGYCGEYSPITFLNKIREELERL